MSDPSGIVVLVSGRGSNLEAIIRAHQGGDLAWSVRGVISDQPLATALEYACAAGIPAHGMDPHSFQSRDDFERRLAELIDDLNPHVIALAGFMRILSAGFTRRYSGRLLNIHPSLLPAHPGLHTHQKVLAAGETIHGASVHFVTEQVDAGPVVLQSVVSVLPDDDVETLAQRVLRTEHRIYPRVLQWLADGRLIWQEGMPWLDHEPLTKPIRWYVEKT